MKVGDLVSLKMKPISNKEPEVHRALIVRRYRCPVRETWMVEVEWTNQVVRGSYNEDDAHRLFEVINESR